MIRGECDGVASYHLSLCISLCVSLVSISSGERRGSRGLALYGGRARVHCAHSPPLLSRSLSSSSDSILLVSCSAVVRLIVLIGRTVALSPVVQCSRRPRCCLFSFSRYSRLESHAAVFEVLALLAGPSHTPSPPPHLPHRHGQRQRPTPFSATSPSFLLVLLLVFVSLSAALTSTQRRVRAGGHHGVEVPQVRCSHAHGRRHAQGGASLRQVQPAAHGLCIHVS